MAEGSGVTGFMKGTTGGLPNWAWVLIVGGGIAAAYLLPKFFGGGASTNSSSTPTTGTDTTSGIGLAIDPTTGLPYAVEGLVPSGAYAGGGSIGQTGPTGPTGPAGTSASLFQELPQGTIIWQGGAGRWWYETPGGGQKLLLGGAGALLPSNATVQPGPSGRWWANIGGTQYALVPTFGSQVLPAAAGSTITVQNWPSGLMSLSGLASKYGVSTERLQQLNPGISNTLHPGQKVKIA